MFLESIRRKASKEFEKAIPLRVKQIPSIWASCAVTVFISHINVCMCTQPAYQCLLWM